jgi:predicted dehydrogenase
MKRILLIGVGRWGINQLRVLKSMSVELFIADHHEQRLNSVDIPQSHRSTDARALFSKVDAAVVVTPAPAHFETCSELLALGKDVFVEKPITLASGEAKKLTELAEKSGLILQVGHIFRFDPASLWMRDAIVEQQFGRLKMLQARFSGFKRPRQDTGVTFADSIHFINLFNLLLGVPPRRVHAVLSDFSGRGMDDESLIVLEYYQSNGSPILATIEAGYHTPGKFREVTIMGTRSSAVCDYNLAQYKIRTFANQHVADGVCGTRATTRGKGDNWIRIASSRVANWVRNKLSGENISDAGYTYRVFKRECIAHVKFFNGAHRFLPTLIKMEGFCVIEVPVSTNPRFSGTSHYGVWNRLFKSFRDLLAVRWMKSRRIQYEIAESVTSL